MNELTRRDVIKASAVGAAGVLAGKLLSAPEQVLADDLNNDSADAGNVLVLEMPSDKEVAEYEAFMAKFFGGSRATEYFLANVSPTWTSSAGLNYQMYVLKPNSFTMETFLQVGTSSSSVFGNDWAVVTLTKPTLAMVFAYVYPNNLSGKLYYYV